MDGYERRYFGKYEGVYTSEEIELNKKLFEECQKQNIDFALVEELLQQGADPIGPTAGEGLELFDHIYGELTMCYSDEEGSNFSKLTELFLKHGMDVSKPRIPYDEDESLHPMWEFAFMSSDDSIVALKMLLDSGLDADSFGQCWGHDVFDLYNLSCGDPEKDEFCNRVCTWTMKTVMLGASYDYILNNDEDLRSFIGFDYNSYDIHNFRQWDNYEYFFDTTHCLNGPRFYRSVVSICEKGTGKEVWRVGIAMKKGEF